MRFKRNYSIVKGQLNLTPLIDVIFLLFIYFMLTSTFIMQPGIRIELPQAATTETIREQEVFVSVSREGVIFYQDMPVSELQLEEFLKAALREERAREIILVVKGDTKAEHGIIVGVMDIARRLGINRIAVATTPDL